MTGRTLGAMLILATPLGLHAQLDEPLGSASWAVGELDGPVVFRELTDADRLRDGRVVVLDRRSQKVWIVYSDGRIARSFGGAGDGPGEFQWPVAVAVANDRVYVLDQGASRIAAFLDEDSVPTFERFVPLPGLFHDLCVLRERIFVLGLVAGNAIHELSADGAVLRSFDPAPSAEQTDFIGQEEQGFYSSGRLACHATTDRIAVSPTMRKAVRIFDANGERVRQVAIPDFHEARLEPTASGYGMRPDPETGRVTQTEAMGMLPEGVWVQVQELDPSGGGKAGPLRTWLIGRDGATELPVHPRLLLVTDGLILGGLEEPFPQLRAWRVGGE